METRGYAHAASSASATLASDRKVAAGRDPVRVKMSGKSSGTRGATAMGMPTDRSLSAIRLQAAIVRSLVDEVDRAVPPDSVRDVSVELADELARLSARILENAAALREASIPPPPRSGVARRDEGAEDDAITSEDAAASGR